LIFHLIEIANGAEAGPVTLTSTKQAAAWCDYLESHARRIYGLVSDIKLQAASRLAQKIEEGVLQDGFSARDVYRKEWSLLDTKELTQGAIEELVEAGWLREEASQAQENGRPPLPIYRINPKLKVATDKTDKSDSVGSVSDHKGVSEDFEAAKVAASSASEKEVVHAKVDAMPEEKMRL